MRMTDQKTSSKPKLVQVGDTVSFSSRSVAKSCISRETAEGKGAVARRSIGSDAFPAVDPFIMLDDFTVNQPAGFLDHAHRGLETVTFLRPDSQGSMCHEDFLGHKGTLNPGDVQFMNAGKGTQFLYHYTSFCLSSLISHLSSLVFFFSHCPFVVVNFLRQFFVSLCLCLFFPYLRNYARGNANEQKPVNRSPALGQSPF